jgi:MoxR-like ATPase
MHSVQPDHALAETTRLAARLVENLSRVIRGKDEPLRLAAVALLSGGHLLIEDVPGVGKTLLAKSLARSIAGSFGRVQSTPDLLPSDLTGVSILTQGGQNWTFRPGPLFANVVLVDEVNRATPRTQSALLEAMEERQITVDGETRHLPEPFFLVATQNPIEHAGTFPLVESQRDRFAVVIEMGHPARPAQRELLLGRGGVESLDELAPVTDAAGLRRAIECVRHVHCEPAVADYIIDLSEATRAHTNVVMGASPRATLGVLHAAQAHAAISGRSFVTPDDVKAVAAPSLAHRLILAGGPDIRSGAAVVRSLLENLRVPTG